MKVAEIKIEMNRLSTMFLGGGRAEDHFVKQNVCRE